MVAPGPRAQLEQVRAEIEGISAEFADVAEEAARSSLRAALDRFVEAHANELQRLDEATLDAFRQATSSAIDRGAADVGRRLRRPDLWLSPTVLNEVDDEWLDVTWRDSRRLIASMHRRRRPAEPEKQLDHLDNRAWIAILNAADPLDPVMKEFGFPPGDTDPGGGHYGLQPRSTLQFDGSGRIAVLWTRYLDAFARWRATLEASKGERKAGFLRRWREGR